MGAFPDIRRERVGEELAKFIAERLNRVLVTNVALATTTSFEDLLTNNTALLEPVAERVPLVPPLSPVIDQGKTGPVKTCRASTRPSPI